MKIRSMVFSGATLGLGAAALFLQTAVAQPLYDRVNVNMPYSVTVGHKVLPPGDYVIQQQRSQADSGVLLIYSGPNGMHFETSMMSNKALPHNPENTPENTTITLHHLGNDYYYDKIFVQGKTYGYQIPLPSSVKSREKEMASVSVPAEATTVSGDETNTNTTTDTTTTTAAVTNTDNNSANSSTANSRVDNTTTNSAIDNSQVTTPVQSADVNTPSSSTMSQDNTQTSPQSTSTDTDNTSSSANRERRDTGNGMPATSAGWLAMLLGGGSLSGVGMMLRRKR